MRRRCIALIPQMIVALLVGQRNMTEITASRNIGERFGVAASRTLGLFLMLVLLSSIPTIAQPEKTPVATSDKVHSPQLSGTVVDTSGAVIAGAAVQVRSPNGTVQRTTRSDSNGSFIISGLSAGNYRLVVSNPGFETKEIPITIAATEAPASLRISLIVGSLSTTINVQGRQDDLVGIAESATQGTVGATEIQDRPILRSGEVLETVPG
ncbi:MAG: carboxypeptidase-like regulatory domain-containing protein, partial [Terriglobales bacterium]